MNETTVKLTVDSVWQDGTPFSGLLEVTLLELGTTENNLIAPKRQQEIYFEDGRVEINLVPSSAMNGAKYRIRIITTAVAGGYKSKTILYDKIVSIPDSDCSLHDLVADED